jgi:hypothetical protein
MLPALLLCLLAGNVCCAFARAVPDVPNVRALPSAPTALEHAFRRECVAHAAGPCCYPVAK